MKIIYLDIDGVINSLSKKPPRQNTQWLGEWSEKKIEGYRILWSNELVEALNELADREDVQIKWLTTWRNLAAESFAEQVGLNGTEWPYFWAEDRDMHYSQEWWKFNKIKEDVEKEEPELFVWLDDDLMYDRKAREWVETCDNVVAISPESTHGLTKNHIKAITDLLDQNVEALKEAPEYNVYR